jgi:hypothetical protein
MPLMEMKTWSPGYPLWSALMLQAPSSPPVRRKQSLNTLPLSLSLTAVRVFIERGDLKDGLQKVPKRW